MASKYARKTYVENGIYHVFNRCINKEALFNSPWDYKTFEKTLVSSLEKCESVIDLFAYCLMPNHWHFVLQQKGAKDITMFMRRFEISLASKFNKHYARVGHMFQGVYKARLVTEAGDLVKVVDYVHMNPRELRTDYENYPYSSLRIYKNPYPSFVNVRKVLSLFEYSPKRYLDHVKNEIGSTSGSDLSLDPISELI